jgi:periplasmic protein TonB
MLRHSPAVEPQPDLALPDAHAAGQQSAATHISAHVYASPAHSSRLLFGAIAVSGGLHVAAAAAMLLAHSSLPETGMAKHASDAISMEREQSIVLESVVSTPVKASAASAVMPEGVAEPSEESVKPIDPIKPRLLEEGPPPSAVKATEVRPDVTETAEDSLQVIAGAGEPDAVIEAKTVTEEKKEEPQRERKTQKKKEDHKQAKRRKTQQQRGGATSRAQAAGKKSGGRASASRGSAINYAARVRAKVARNRPSVRGHRGTARVSFGLSSSGGLSYVRVSRSSGSSTLDRAAVSAVRRAAPFGRPPAGAALRFNIPFYFR